MNIQHNDELRDRLSAAYVLGTLKGGARRRFETLRKESALIEQEVLAWQERLNPLAEFSTAVTPPPHVWHAIEKQLERSATQQDSYWSFWRQLRNDLSFWRGLGMVSTSAAVIMVAVLTFKQPDQITPTASYVATLTDDKSQAVMVITGDVTHHQLIAKILLNQPLAADKSMELWAVPKNGPPHSLGLIAAHGTVKLALPDDVTPQSVPLLAVSVEPKGGSPNPNGPTGPIVLKGAWVQI